MTTREEIVAQARTYIRTPFHHMARLPGVGLDCAGVLICAARDLGLVAPDFDVPAYQPNPDGVSMLDLCDRFMTRIPQHEMRPGDAIVVTVDVHPQHLGVVGDYLHGGLSIIHAANYAKPPSVIETRLMFSRVQRFAAAYTFPGIE